MQCETSPCANQSTGTANEIFSLLLNYLTISQCSLSQRELWPMDYGEFALRRGFNEYDFIIVGAGSAGSVIANRLSENPKWKVLLLEAGEDPPIESAVPAFSISMFNSKYDWRFPIEPSDRYSLLLDDGRFMPKGKMLGGSSSLNGMMYVRGNEENFNTWEALGNPTWGWRNVLEYFKKSEKNQDFGGKYHSKNGLLSVELFRCNDSICSLIIKAAQEIGFNFIEDINADAHIGFTSGQGNIRAGVRDSTAKAFLVPAKNRPNLHVVKHAHVLNIEINANVASGVMMLLRGQRMKAYAKNEVILSAGSINSPQILMSSGIGPEQHLNEMGIPVIKDLPVGQNLGDHPLVMLVLKLNLATVAPVKEELMQSFIQYLINHTGRFATTGSKGLGFVNVQNPLDKYPDFNYLHNSFRQGQFEQVSTFLKTLGFVDEVSEAVATQAETSDLLCVSLLYLKEKSRGKVLLRSAEPTEKPRIILNYLSEPEDIEAFIKAIRLYLNFLTSRTFKALHARLFVLPIPGCAAIKFNSDEFWECYCRHMVSTGYHIVGTAKMGPDSDPDAVVDHRLRVKGIKNLRVVDASIMPMITSGPTNSPTIMIGEKGADFIKEDNAGA